MSFETIKLSNYVCQALPNGSWHLNEKVFKAASANDCGILLKVNFQLPGTIWRSCCLTFRKVRVRLCIYSGLEGGGEKWECGNYRNHPACLLNWMQLETGSICVRHFSWCPGWAWQSSCAAWVLDWISASLWKQSWLGRAPPRALMCGDGLDFFIVVWLDFFNQPAKKHHHKNQHQTPYKHLTGITHFPWVCGSNVASNSWMGEQAVPMDIPPARGTSSRALLLLHALRFYQPLSFVNESGFKQNSNRLFPAVMWVCRSHLIWCSALQCSCIPLYLLRNGSGECCSNGSCWLCFQGGSIWHYPLLRQCMEKFLQTVVKVVQENSPVCLYEGGKTTTTLELLCVKFVCVHT